ncbi:hypothetical protein SAMN05421823_11593 [Catalinimonas alkaloidigena]|uniref:Mannosylglycerate hydrolase MGH1-like glycoside hydrolase domain-containing protein n=2 Tax=Catalinimonas alkaloidigena TaxID=1075417 RepID=A0A1G9U5G0_9BACT|nr:hypothetical protein SAMN05421823_11593 [Catalinimonas alkaloidigena]
MSHQTLREKVGTLMRANMVHGYSNEARTDYYYTKPSPKTYPFQFFWDTCFHAFILCALGESEMAKQHLMSLFALQQTDGFVGHIIYWNNVLPGRATDIFQSRPGLGVNLFKTHMSALIQPPFVAQVAARLYEANRDRAFLKQVVQKLKRYYQWIAQNRDFDGDGLITIISPFESGMDWKPTFDPVLGFRSRKANWQLFMKVVSVDFRNFCFRYDLKKIRKHNYFRVKEVGMNTVYIQNLYVLASLCREINDPDADDFDQLADKALESLIRLSYDADKGAFLDLYGPENKKINILTPTIFFPLAIKKIDPSIVARVMASHWFNQDEFAVTYPMPSVAVNHPSFNPDSSLFLWRGPTWIYLNWFLHDVLRQSGYKEAALHLVETVKALLEKSGFREYYHPFTGKGMGAQNFTWAGLILDMVDERT